MIDIEVGGFLIIRCEMKGGSMDDFDIDYIVIKLKKKSPRHKDEEKS